MKVISLEQAQKEFQKWADAKRLSEKVIEKHIDDKEAMVDAIMNGNLILNEDNTLKQILEFPVKDGQVKELVYKFRITEGELAASTRGIRTDDLIGQFSLCYVAALTGQDRGTIRVLDSVDVSLGKHIAAFFSV